MKKLAVVAVVTVICCAATLTAQSADDTQLKQVIIFGRHSVRSPIAPNSFLNTVSTKPYPDFGVFAPGILTADGKTRETRLGGYNRLRFIQEGLITGNDSADADFVYFRANMLGRTAKALSRIL